jgi:hypothetical protein
MVGLLETPIMQCTRTVPPDPLRRRSLKSCSSSDSRDGASSFPLLSSVSLTRGDEAAAESHSHRAPSRAWSMKGNVSSNSFSIFCTSKETKKIASASVIHLNELIKEELMSSSVFRHQPKRKGGAVASSKPESTCSIEDEIQRTSGSPSSSMSIMQICLCTIPRSVNPFGHTIGSFVAESTWVIPTLSIAVKARRLRTLDFVNTGMKYLSNLGR